MFGSIAKLPQRNNFVNLDEITAGTSRIPHNYECLFRQNFQKRKNTKIYMCKCMCMCVCVEGKTVLSFPVTIISIFCFLFSIWMVCCCCGLLLQNQCQALKNYILALNVFFFWITIGKQIHRKNKYEEKNNKCRWK